MCYVLVLLYHNVGQIANLSYTRTRLVLLNKRQLNLDGHYSGSP